MNQVLEGLGPDKCIVLPGFIWSDRPEQGYMYKCRNYSNVVSAGMDFPAHF
jgi:hypothetical protein